MLLDGPNSIQHSSTIRKQETKLVSWETMARRASSRESARTVRAQRQRLLAGLCKKGRKSMIQRLFEALTIDLAVTRLQRECTWHAPSLPSHWLVAGNLIKRMSKQLQ